MDECSCTITELAVNPARECTACHKFIGFDCIEDFLAWSKSERVDKRVQESQAEFDAAAE